MYKFSKLLLLFYILFHPVVNHPQFLHLHVQLCVCIKCENFEYYFKYYKYFFVSNNYYSRTIATTCVPIHRSQSVHVGLKCFKGMHCTLLFPIAFVSDVSCIHIHERYFPSVKPKVFGTCEIRSKKITEKKPV